MQRNASGVYERLHYPLRSMKCEEWRRQIKKIKAVFGVCRLRSRGRTDYCYLPTPTVVAWVEFSSAFMFVCLFVCLFVYLSVFLHDIWKTDADRIVKRDKEMFHHESWQPIYFGAKGQRYKKTLPTWIMALSWVLASSSSCCGCCCRTSRDCSGLATCVTDRLTARRNHSQTAWSGTIW